MRDPFARLVSCWAYAFGMGASSVGRFRSWVAAGCPLAERYRLDLGAGRRVWMHAPQAEWITDEDGRLIVPDLVRLERAAQDWPRVAGKIGAAPQFGQENRSEHREPDVYYDATTRDLVAQRYARDFDLLGYSFEG